MGCSAVTSVGSIMLPMSKNWVLQNLSKEMNVAFSSAVPASLNVFADRKVLDVFIPLPWAIDGYSHQRRHIQANI